MPESIVVGYQRLRLDSRSDAAEAGRLLLRTFAERNGFELRTIFTDLAAEGQGAFDALLAAIVVEPVAFVLVPSLDHLSLMPRLRQAMCLRLERAGGARVLDAESWLRIRSRRVATNDVMLGEGC